MLNFQLSAGHLPNTERQRLFRERNPGYYKRLHARRRAKVNACVEALARQQAIAKLIAPPESSMPPPERCLPAPEHVTISLGDRLPAELCSARAASRSEAVAIEVRSEALEVGSEQTGDRRQEAGGFRGVWQFFRARLSRNAIDPRWRCR